MKKIKIAYYIVTAIFTAFIALGAIFDVRAVPEARTIITHLGYPVYILYTVGWAKLLGVIGVWQPKSPTLREWAYAGITFDLLGALFSHLASGDGPQGFLAPVIPLLLLTASYLLHRKYHGSLAVKNV